MAAKIIQFDDATNEQIQIAAKFAGIDEVSNYCNDIIGDEILSGKGRAILIHHLRDFGYKAISVDGGFTSAVE